MSFRDARDELVLKDLRASACKGAEQLPPATGGGEKLASYTAAEVRFDARCRHPSITDHGTEGEVEWTSL